MIELADRWALPIVGRSVTRCCVDYAFSIDLWSPDGTLATVRIGGPFVYRRPDGTECRPHPDDDASSVAPALAVFGSEIREAAAFKTGALAIRFSDGSVIHAAPDPKYEAWEMAGPGGEKVVSVPGGDLAVWLPEP